MDKEANWKQANLMFIVTNILHSYLNVFQHSMFMISYHILQIIT